MFQITRLTRRRAEYKAWQQSFDVGIKEGAISVVTSAVDAVRVQVAKAVLSHLNIDFIRYQSPSNISSQFYDIYFKHSDHCIIRAKNASEDADPRPAHTTIA